MELWTHKNIKALIYSNDHCQPHVTFVCVSDKWTARIRFSMVKSEIKLVDVKPEKNDPGVKLINELANQVWNRLAKCRMGWWSTKNGELCIDNRGVQPNGAGKVLLDGPNPSGTIMAKSGKYVKKKKGKGFEVRAIVVWKNGSVALDQIVE